MDKSLIAALILFPLTAWGQTHTMPGSNVVPSGASLTIQSGGTINAAAGSTVTGFTPYAGTLTITTGKTFNVTNNLTLSGTDGSTLNVGAGGTLGTAAYTASTAYQAQDIDLGTWAGITPSVELQSWIATPSSANLRLLMSDENGTGALLFSGATSPVFVTPDLGTPSALVATNVTGTADGLTAGNVTRDHAVYAAASPPTVDVGMFTIVKTGVNLKAAATTNLFTVPTSRRFAAVKAYAVVTAVTAAGSGISVFKIIESGGGGLTATGTSGTSTPAVGSYYSSETPPATGRYDTAPAGNSVQIQVSASHAGSTAVTGDVYVQGFYIQ